MTYTITRYYRDKGDPLIIATGLTLDEALEHCNDPETSSSTATNPVLDYRGPWFDGFTSEH